VGYRRQSHFNSNVQGDIRDVSAICQTSPKLGGDSKIEITCASPFGHFM
jgi:hypothetical protein